MYLILLLHGLALLMMSQTLAAGHKMAACMGVLLPLSDCLKKKKMKPEIVKRSCMSIFSLIPMTRVCDAFSLQFHFKPSGEAFITLFVWCPSTEHMVKYHGTQCCLQRHGHQPAQLKISLTWSHTAGPTKNTTLLHRNGRFVLLACLRNYRKLQRWLMFNAPILVWAVSQHTNTRNNSKNIH